MIRIIAVLVMVMALIMLTLFINVTESSAEEFEVTLNWSHSGISMDRFVFQYGSANVGPWTGGQQTVMIADLTPTPVIDPESNLWEVTITVDIENVNELRWWIVYAESSWGVKSNLSLPAESVYIKSPGDLLRKSDFPNKKRFSVTFI